MATIKPLQVTYRQTPELAPYARNARTHSDEQVQQLVASIKEFGWTNPVLIDDEGSIIAGHGRVLAAQQMNIFEVPCIELGGLTEVQKRAYRLADNQLPLNAGWDVKLLQCELTDLKSEGFDIDLTGFDSGFLDELFAEKKGKTDPDDAPPVMEIPVSKTGDIWQLGTHRLMCGDATLPADVQALCEERQVDMWLTDPPYNVDYTGKTRAALKIKNDRQCNEDFRTFLNKAYVAADGVMKAGAVFYIWHADIETLNFRGAALDTGWQVRQCIIWNKLAWVIGRSDYHWQHEPCLYGWKGGAAHLWAGDRKQSTVIDCPRPVRNDDHPTMKPVDLFEPLIVNSTRGGDIILDTFAGAGVTLIAAEKTGRIARLIENDPRYVDVIIRRWQAFTGRIAIHVEMGKPFNEMRCCREIPEVVSPPEE